MKLEMRPNNITLRKPTIHFIETNKKPNENHMKYNQNAKKAIKKKPQCSQCAINHRNKRRIKNSSLPDYYNNQKIKEHTAHNHKVPKINRSPNPTPPETIHLASLYRSTYNATCQIPINKIKKKQKKKRKVIINGMTR